MKYRVCVLGSGAWGTVMASLLADKGNQVVVYGIVEQEINEINQSHTNKKYLGESFKINQSVKATLDFNLAMEGANVVVFAVPSFAIKEMAIKVKPFVRKDTLLINLAKGFDKISKKTLGQTIREEIGEKYCKNVVSLLGPSFAEEVSEKQNTAITASGASDEFNKLAQEIVSNEYLRIYTNNDWMGAEVCSSLKNVVALACGIIDGLGCKVNTRSALITRGMAEIKRFVVEMGGVETTCYGLAGVGDLILTCSSKTSRNYSAGYQIGVNSIDEFYKTNTKTVEGVYACEIAYEIAKEKKIYSPIINAVYGVVFRGENPKKAVKDLMSLSLKSE